MKDDTHTQVLSKIHGDHDLRRLYERHRELDERVDKLARSSPMTPAIVVELKQLKVRRARLKQELFRRSAAA